MAASRRRFPQVKKIGTPEAMRAYLAEQGIDLPLDVADQIAELAKFFGAGLLLEFRRSGNGIDDPRVESQPEHVLGLREFHTDDGLRRDPLRGGRVRFGRNGSNLLAAERNSQTVWGEYGQVPGGMFGGDENCRPGYDDPRQAIETCGIAEQMLSDEILLRTTGDPFWADHCEEVAFNTWPAAFTADYRALRYLTSAIFCYYVLHQTITIIAGYYLTRLRLGVAAESLLVLTFTVAGCVVGYEVIRRIPKIGILFGVHQVSGYHQNR